MLAYNYQTLSSIQTKFVHEVRFSIHVLGCTIENVLQYLVSQNILHYQIHFSKYNQRMLKRLVTVSREKTEYDKNDELTLTASTLQ